MEKWQPVHRGGETIQVSPPYISISLVWGILARIAEMGYPVSGFDAYVTADVPGVSGLSSSACFEVLM